MGRKRKRSRLDLRLGLVRGQEQRTAGAPDNDCVLQTSSQDAFFPSLAGPPCLASPIPRTATIASDATSEQMGFTLSNTQRPSHRTEEGRSIYIH